MTTTESRTTHELRVGDVVLNDGMRLLIDQPILTSRVHDDRYGPVLYTRALITNVAELVARMAAGDTYIAGFILAMADRKDDEPGVYRWTIQGNRLARWPVAIEPPLPVDSWDSEYDRDAPLDLGHPRYGR